VNEYIQFETDEAVDNFRAEAWVRYYEDALTRWRTWLELPDEQLPPVARAYRASGNGPPKYGQPIDLHGRSGTLKWVTQACLGITIHPVVGGGGIVVVYPGRGGAKSRIRRWAEEDDPVTVLSTADLRGIRAIGMDRRATRARALIGLAPGAPRQRLAKTVPSALIQRDMVEDRWEQKLVQVSARGLKLKGTG